MLKQITFVTLFPEVYNSFLEHSIIKRAVNKGKIKVQIVNFREDSLDPHHKVDHPPYGGGPGMVLAIEPIVRCLNRIRTAKSQVWLLSPAGETFNQNLAEQTVSEIEELIFLCGHYEGFDYRIQNYIDREISLGDFILTGGEIASQVMAESLIRLVDGVIRQESLLSESFCDALLDYPVYTKPRVFENHSVPEVLLSGNHQAIAKYRQAQRVQLTKEKRPDLYQKYLGKENKDGCKN